MKSVRRNHSSAAETVKCLLDAGSDASATSNAGEIALMHALSTENDDTAQVVELLLQHGAEVSETVRKGRCPADPHDPTGDNYECR